MRPTIALHPRQSAVHLTTAMCDQAHIQCLFNHPLVREVSHRLTRPANVLVPFPGTFSLESGWHGQAPLARVVHFRSTGQQVGPCHPDPRMSAYHFGTGTSRFAQVMCVNEEGADVLSGTPAPVCGLRFSPNQRSPLPSRAGWAFPVGQSVTRPGCPHSYGTTTSHDRFAPVFASCAAPITRSEALFNSSGP